VATGSVYPSGDSLQATARWSRPSGPG